MQIVIDIDKDVFERIKSGIPESVDCFKCEEAVLYGTPLPENHGRLIDVDSLFSWFDGESRAKYPIEDGKQYDTMMIYEIFDEIDNALTIIEGTEGLE